MTSIKGRTRKALLLAGIGLISIATAGFAQDVPPTPNSATARSKAGPARLTKYPHVRHRWNI